MNLPTGVWRVYTFALILSALLLLAVTARTVVAIRRWDVKRTLRNKACDLRDKAQTIVKGWGHEPHQPGWRPLGLVALSDRLGPKSQKRLEELMRNTLTSMQQAARQLYDYNSLDPLAAKLTAAELEKVCKRYKEILAAVQRAKSGQTKLEQIHNEVAVAINQTAHQLTVAVRDLVRLGDQLAALDAEGIKTGHIYRGALEALLENVRSEAEAGEWLVAADLLKHALTEHETLSKEAASLPQQLQEAHTEHVHLAAQAELLDTQLTVAERQLTQLSQRFDPACLAEAAEQLTMWRGQQRQFDVRLGALEQLIEAQDWQQIREMTADLQGIIRMTRAACTQVAELKGELEDGLADVQCMLAKLGTALTDLRNNRLRRAGDQNSLNEQVNDVAARLAAAREALQGSQPNPVEIAGELGHLRGDIDDLERQSQKLADA